MYELEKHIKVGRTLRKNSVMDHEITQIGIRLFIEKLIV